ncbi:16S rRNA (guanine(527)-N(7))-methyltransferase RsmG [Azospirillum sp. TSO22-1]|uniref:16S rRNA (guanine(527)-N(7))-methyltransferase RsmG n=1 Tax=Azospirillum sp. TSO22-1 TaxID=716789 RepID=UPI000D613410|nr:16S rRNA (guanine(527)-N(7))-methyltransferase RsmG [Azospirillum sp. TSO22-1]PWC52598.1 16S rRNA methyltransferase [Azospirillum sp. TSO22-1]
MVRLDAEGFRKATGVSRETLERLTVYEALLRKWQKTINLVGPKTLDDAWSRHFLDSAQLYPLLPESTKVLVDLGSGAGFPGLVLAILGVPEVHLIESDVRKGAFLREAARATGAAVTVHSKRIEAVQGLQADVLTARALAPLADLLDWGARFLTADGVALFLKGQNVEDELTDSTKYWKMRTERFDSVTDPSGSILRLSGIVRV